MNKLSLEKKRDGSSKKSNKPASRKDGKENQENLVLDTAGGEMPDPDKMPSASKFQSDKK